MSNTTPLEMWEVLFTTKAKVGYVAGSAFITGWLLDVILIVMVMCSMPFVRRSGHFQVSTYNPSLTAVDPGHMNMCLSRIICVVRPPTESLMILKYTVSPPYTDTRYNDKILNAGDLSDTKPSLKK